MAGSFKEYQLWMVGLFTKNSVAGYYSTVRSI